MASNGGHDTDEDSSEEADSKTTHSEESDVKNSEADNSGTDESEGDDAETNDGDAQDSESDDADEGETEAESGGAESDDAEVDDAETGKSAMEDSSVDGSTREVKGSDDFSSSNSESKDNASEPQPKRRKTNAEANAKVHSKMTDSEDDSETTDSEAVAARVAAKIGLAKLGRKFDPHAVTSWLRNVNAPTAPSASADDFEIDGSEVDRDPSVHGEDDSEETESRASKVASAQQHNANADTSHAPTSGSLSMQARDRMRHTGVHPFNLPMDDLQMLADSSGRLNASRMGAFAHTQPQDVEELHQLLVSASISSTSVSQDHALATANADVQAAQVTLRNTELKERMATLRAEQAAVEVEEAKRAVNDARKKAKEAKNSLGQSGEFEAEDEHEKNAAAKHNALMAEIDTKILELRAQKQDPDRQPEASTGPVDNGQKRKRTAK